MLRFFLSIGFLGALLPALEAQGTPNSAPPDVQQVYPGIWRLRFGTPEALTPLHFRSAPARGDALGALPPGALPFDPAQLVFNSSPARCSLRLPMTDDERIYGFGLNSQIFEMTKDGDHHPGRRVFIRPSDNPENDLNDSHAPVPFYVSNAGYGVYVDTARYASFDTGNVNPVGANATAHDDHAAVATSTSQLYAAHELAKKTMLVDVPGASGIDVYVFAGPSMREAVERYNLFSGGGALPPLWGLGIGYRGFGSFTADDTLKLASAFRDQHLPCDIWGLEPGWQSHAYSCSFTWNTGAFPSPDDFVQQMTALGYHINAWEHGYTHSSSPIHDALRPFSGDYLVWDGLVPDFATPEARKIFGGLQEQSLFSKGVDGVKLDECDSHPDSAGSFSFPDAARFPSGLDGEQMHLLLGELFQQTELEALHSHHLRTWSFVRDSGALAAPLPFVVYSDSYTESDYLRALVKEGFSGLMWTPEIRNAGSVEELYRRIEEAMFAPQLLVNCWFLKHPPWFQINTDQNNAGQAMPEQVDATLTVKKLFEMRMSFVPYLYAAFNDYRLAGTPPVRALVMDWPQDAATQDIDDEFMAGPSLLVAPIQSGQKGRQVYLPAGDWYDYGTGEKIAGGKSIAVSKPLDQLPIYVKSGTLLPLADPVDHVAPDTCFQVNVRVYGDGSRPATLYEDDGVSDKVDSGEQNKLTLTWNGSTIAVDTKGGYKGPARYKITGSTPIK